MADALKALDLATIRAFLQERLQKLISLAKRTRWPLSVHALSRLCIAPTDLLPIRENRLYFFDGYTTWEDLDRSDLCKLDPEGASKVVFQYLSPTAEFLFQLPFRQAALFVSAERLRSLPCPSDVGQECGVYQGQLIGNEDGRQRSAEEILQDLGVDIASVCPHRLV
ncbi:MAG TPA: hypothetical protein VFV38_33200, partial [Ktedonobacteraceae bacterium]|nr:hypothetical protein [Ktedonobacteraceae bacterium]